VIPLVTCFGFLFVFQCEEAKPTVIDSYCANYERVIRRKGEGAITADPVVKQRIAANEVNYRCLCEGWTSPLCRSAKK